MVLIEDALLLGETKAEEAMDTRASFESTGTNE